MAQQFQAKIQRILHGPPLTSPFKFVEQKTNFKREYIAIGLVAALVLYLAFGRGNDFLCDFICFLGPAYISLLATQSSTLCDTTKWRIYWVIYASFKIIECGRVLFTFSIPFYWLGKCLFFIWLMLSDRKDLVYQQIIRGLALLSGFLKPTGSFLIVNPPNENVELHIFTTSGGPDLVKLRPDRNGRVSLTSVKDGTYTMIAYSVGTTPPLELSPFRLQIVNRVPSVSHIDVQATTLHVTFKRHDSSVQGARVVGVFMGRRKNSHNLTGRTDDDGVVTFVLPEGWIHDLVAEKDKVEVKKIGGITLPPPTPTQVDMPRPSKYIIIDVDSSSFSSSVNPMSKNARVVILGDMSGSMSSGNNMDILRRSFQDIFLKCQKNGWHVALASWDEEIEWCIENRWIQPSDTHLVQKWIQAREARGGNDMKSAIEDCMQRHPDATDVYVMCDGDIEPFVLHEEEPNWARFRNQYPKTIFHFIALGTGASYEPMEAMASIGGGTFTHNT